MALKDKALGPSLTWLSQMLSFFSSDVITIPGNYREQVIKIKALLSNDVSGLANSILDFAIKSALVNYRVETNNSNLTTLFNNWINNINSDLRGTVPTGINALAKEYFRELWKGSSFILLRSVWEDVDGMVLPTKLWFVEGEDILVEDGNKEMKVIGDEKYYLRINESKKQKLPSEKNEEIFIQKPFSSWGTLQPIPFLIQRGVFENISMLDVLLTRGQRMIDKALEYILLMKKGDRELAKMQNPDFIYSKEDLTEVSEDITKFAANRKTKTGLSAYVTNFDTELEHIIPEYSRILKQELYTPVERRILAGLGMVEVVEGITTTRREAVLNPKPFKSIVEQGVEDFKLLLNDVLETIKQKNSRRRKYWGKIIKIYNDPIQEFITKEAKEVLRNAYDRGSLSKRTYTELVAERDFDIEVDRRQEEKDDGLEDLMYPPVIQNFEQYTEGSQDPDGENENENKTGPEAKNFNQSTIFEQAPYKKIADLPNNITNVLPKRAQAIWMKVFNDIVSEKGESSARKIAWTAVKNAGYKKGKDGHWTKEKGNLT